MGAGRDREDEALHLVLGNVEARQDLELRASESGIRVRNPSQESESGNRQHLELREGCTGVRARD